MQKKDPMVSQFFGEDRSQKSIVIVLVLLIILIGAFFVFDFKNNRSKTLGSVNQPVAPAMSDTKVATTPNSAVNQQLLDVTTNNASLSELIKKVGKHIFLPSGQVTVSTVVDADALRKDNPVFYQFAKKGDRVLIYATEAILYDPVVDLVLDVAHVTPSPTK